MKLQQRLSHGLRCELADRAFVVKLHLALGGVDVHIDGRWIDLEEEAADRVATLHQRCVVALDEREVEAAILDWPFVHEQVLIFASRTSYTGRTNNTPKTEVMRAACCVFRRGRLVLRFCGRFHYGSEIHWQELLFVAEE